MHRSLDQIRADLAYRQVQDHAKNEEFLGMAQKLPVMLQKNGLLATWAFLVAKEQETMIEIFLTHFRNSILGLNCRETGDGKVVLQNWVGVSETEDQPKLSGVELRRLTDEAVALAVWMKRAAEALGA